ncbi:uncharacterized protein E6C27_scaffold57G001380 [Cucumis melo var. makuwa]|uniref:CCHC-type domain-containing protein n=1 Tax=Cucumis melo var. makuwa TaxID=1194695 RepID=A0A5A7SX02_CUCMM|nr:uncharacterized protein E6C27_scaffold57G001380 [Cucumis melo var. makuwa]
MKLRLTGLKPAASALTGQCSDQLNYNPRKDKSQIAHILTSKSDAREPTTIKGTYLKEENDRSEDKWQLVFTRNQEVSGFSCISECIGGVRISIWNKLKRSCARDSGSGSVLRVICVYARGIRFICLQIPLLTLSVLRNNDAVVEIDFPVPVDCLSLRKLHYRLPVSLGLLVKSVNFESRQIQVQKSVVRRLHAIFRSKVAGVMPPRTGRQRRQNQDGMQGPTQGPSVGESSTLGVRGGAGNEQFARTTQEIGRTDRAEPSDPEKAYGIERLKKLGATVFEGSTDLADAENWLNMLEKCFDVMNCPEERKVRLATFLLQKEAKGWWKSILARRSDARALDWQTFRGIFEDKYYPSTYCEAKRDEFLGLKQGSLSVAEYERKYTELSRYADVIIASESDRCRRFERGLRFEIRTPVTAIAKWTNFSQLVETALRVEQSITEEKSAVELSRGTSTASGFRGREQRRFTPGINFSSRQDFKNRSGGQASRNVSYGSVFQRQSQRIPSQPIRSTVRSQPGQESIASTVRRIPCTSCGRNHRGQCLVGAGVCYQCGQPGHFKKDCLQLNMTVQRDQGVGSQTVEQSRVSVVPTEGTSGARQKGVVGRPRQQGKVYAMTQQEVEDAPDVITGTILICNVPADVLFDPGATHSFVSSIFLNKLNRSRVNQTLEQGEYYNGTVLLLTILSPSLLLGSKRT